MQSRTQNIVILENTFYTVLSLRMDILRHIAKLGHPVLVLSTGEHSDIEKLEEDGFRCIDVGSVVLNPWKAFLFFYRLLKTLSRLKPRVIFSFTIRPNIFGSIAARWLEIPIVSNVTGTGPLTTDNSILYQLIRGLYRFAFQKNQTVFFQNSDDMDFFLQRGYARPQQAKLISGSGVDTTYFFPQDKKTDWFCFLMISRLIRDKGVIEFVEASRIIKRIYPEVECQILGPFWSQSIGKNTITKEEMDAWASEGIISYLGYTLDVRPYIKESDVVVLPSYREGCANVLMQAASMERPLIASNVTGCNNLINDEETGYLCEVRNAVDLAEKMQKMYHLSVEKRKEMGSKGRTKMQREYQKSIVLESYAAEIPN